MSASSPSESNCRVCDQPTRGLGRARLLDHDVAYFECEQCGYVQTEHPYWLEQAYSQAINRSDTGILRRNIRNVRVVIRIMWLLGLLRGRVVDWAGGYGLLVRLLRDAGVQAYWRDDYCQNLVVRGFEADDSPSDLVTAFEVLEHLVDPIRDLQRLFASAPSVLLSTELIETPTPTLGGWWYYAPEHGQHIGFYRLSTLRYIAKRLGKRLYSDGRSIHLFTDRELPQWRWRLARRTFALAPVIAQFKLRTLVWDDHRRMNDDTKAKQ